MKKPYKTLLIILAVVAIDTGADSVIDTLLEEYDK